MNKFMMFLLGAFLAWSTQAAAAPPDLRTYAKSVRDGKAGVGKELSMDPKTGRFHKIHAIVGKKKECGTCHVDNENVPADFLLARKDDPLPEKAPGAVDRASCVGCHRQDSVARPWYWVVDKE
jgi:hypothetical protein